METADDKKVNGPSPEVIHKFLDHYRSIGIALCLSLITYAGLELNWLYGHFIEGKVSNTCQLIWWFLVISAVLIFALSFAVQFFHYFGSMWRARAFGGFEDYLPPWHPEAEKNAKDKFNKFNNTSNQLHKIADNCVYGISGIALCNLLLLLLYTIRFHPPK